MRDEMEGQRKQVPILPAAEVTTALVELARLSQRIDVAASNTNDTVAQSLLERLLELCEAQQGALLLTVPNAAGEKPSFLHPISHVKVVRILGLSAMSESDVLARLDTYATTGADLQMLPHERCWMICKLPMSPPSSNLETLPEDYQAESVPTRQPVLPFYALLMLGWRGKGSKNCLARAEKGRNLLPLVADVAGSVIANMLLNEQVHELETSINRQALREMELLKAELLATVSHELRSPLASIKGYAATLLRHEQRISREERREFLLAINEASDRLGVVIDRLLEMSQLETGTITITRAPVNPVHLVREALTAIGQRAKEQGMVTRPGDREGPRSGDREGRPYISVSQRLHGMEEDVLDITAPSQRIALFLRLEDQLGMPTDDEPVIQADRFRLREVLDNLLENALNYSPEGGKIEVIIRPIRTNGKVSRSQHPPVEDHQKRNSPDDALTKPESRQMLEICVRDNGIGIPREHIERIFDHFHRVDTRLTREVNGLGLGLAICKRIVELHDGVIWAESEVGKGSTFHMWLPMDVQ
jgi:signal transduction histidine kinase